MTKELSSRALDGIVDRTLRRAKKVLEEAHRLVDFLDKLEAADKMNFQSLVRLGEKAIRKLPVESGGIEPAKARTYKEMALLAWRLRQEKLS